MRGKLNRLHVDPLSKVQTKNTRGIDDDYVLHLYLCIVILYVGEGGDRLQKSRCELTRAWG